MKNLTQGEFATTTPREIADSLDWPAFVALRTLAGEPDKIGDLRPGERKLSDAEFRAALVARRLKREAERGKENTAPTAAPTAEQHAKPV